MARHGEILDSFKQKVDNFDFTNEEHVTCVRIHCALQDHVTSPADTSCLLYCRSTVHTGFDLNTSRPLSFFSMFQSAEAIGIVLV